MVNTPNPNPSPELQALADIFEHFGNRKQAPGHSHTVPGIWDNDIGNGDKGGTPCEWCATWERARAALSQTPPAPPLLTDVQSAATGFHEQDVSLKVTLPAPGEVEQRTLYEVWRMASRGAENVAHELDRDPKWQPTRADFGSLGTLLLNIAATTRAQAALATVAAANDEEVAEAIEAAAKVAENPGFIEARDTEWDAGVNYAKRYIAAAIRLLSHTHKGVE